MPTIAQAVARNNARPVGPAVPVGDAPVAVGDRPTFQQPPPVGGGIAPVQPVTVSRGTWPDTIIGAPDSVDGSDIPGRFRSRMMIPPKIGLVVSKTTVHITPSAQLNSSAPSPVSLGVTSAQAALLGLNSPTQKSAFVEAVISSGKSKPTL